MNRSKFLVIAVFVLLLAVIAEHFYANWGLITIHAKGQPLSEVIASIQRQGHAHLQTDMPLTTPVTMDVVKVPLADALETLATVTESRWRLLYFVAGDKATLKAAETGWASTGQKPDGWKLVSFPMGNMMFTSDDDDATPPDPRHDTWAIKTAAPAPVQTFLTEGAQATSAGFAYPESWNPTVTSVPAADEVAKVVPKLISAASGKADPVFFLSKPVRRQRTAGDDGGGATMRQGDFPRPDPEIMAARAQAEIKKLPGDQQADAQAVLNKFQALRNLPEDQRREAFQQLMQDPLVQQQMANRMDGRDNRMNHQQRLSHYKSMVSRKLTAMGKTGQ